MITTLRVTVGFMLVGVSIACAVWPAQSFNIPPIIPPIDGKCPEGYSKNDLGVCQLNAPSPTHPAPGVTVPPPGGSCPDGYYKDSVGLCLPKVGGAVGEASEKWKGEIANAKNDLDTWVRTGNCGGDICDAFDAAVKFQVAQIEDMGPSFTHAGERLKEGKPIDAVWHLAMDDLKNTNDNASDALKRSSVLAMTAQVAASAYGGPYGAAAYSAWLTYNRTNGDIGAALKAGIISGLSSAALEGVSNLEIEGVRGVVARSVLTASINGAAVAASGGSQEEVKRAMTMGVATVLIREGYKQLTTHNLDRQRLRSSQGEAYCLEAIPETASDPSCLAPPEAYTRDAQGRVLDSDGNPAAVSGHPPKIDQTKLDPDRPHVGEWADSADAKFIGTKETSATMTGVSRLPGWNAMAVGHDKLVDDYLTTGTFVDVVTSPGTIPPALTLTYVGAGTYIHEMISENVAEHATQPAPESSEAMTAPAPEQMQLPSDLQPPAPTKDAIARGLLPPTEVLHVVCGRVSADHKVTRKLSIMVEAGLKDAHLRPTTSRICEVSQYVGRREYRFWHAHFQRNSCFKKVDDVVRRYQKRGLDCFGSVGLRKAA